MKKLSILMCCIMVVSLVFSGCGNDKKTTDAPEDNKNVETSTDTVDENDAEPIRIGVIQPLSGPLAVSGQDSFYGTKIAFDLINENGGINGRQIEIVSADVPDQTAAQNEVNRLITNEKVDVITGIYGSAMALVAANICDRNDVLYWESISVTDHLTDQGYKGVFRVHVNGTGFGLQAAKIAEAFSTQIGVPADELKVGIICENGDFGQCVAGGVEQYAAESNMPVVLNELYDSKTTDTSPTVLQMKNADPDVVIATSYINDGIDITKQSKILDFSPKLYLGIGSGYGLPAYYESLGENSQGIIDIDPSTTPVYDNFEPELKEAVIEFEKRYEAERGYMPPAIGYLTFQAAWVLAHNVIEVAGGTDDYQAMIDAANAIDIPEGSLPTGAGVKFDENGQNQRAILAAMQWQDGKLVTIYPEYIASGEPIMIPLPAWSER